ncbi:MAG: D-glycero-alpha-D-manno-heptose-1,7-bisphosphate 7-phosphatase [Thermomicrobiales bacterium]
MSQRAVFLDRDGTLVHPRHFPSRPEELVLFDDLETELRELQSSGFRLILITNQSGIARGYFAVADLEAMHAHLARLLQDRGVRLDATYYCPHHPDGTVAEFAKPCDCRKPAPGMLLSAARDLDIDLNKSWFIGDILDDVEAGNRGGCRTVLVDAGTESVPRTPLRQPGFVARNTRHALRIVLAAEGLAFEPDMHYQPAGWQSAAATNARW